MNLQDLFPGADVRRLGLLAFGAAFVLLALFFHFIDRKQENMVARMLARKGPLPSTYELDRQQVLANPSLQEYLRRASSTEMASAWGGILVWSLILVMAPIPEVFWNARRGMLVLPLMLCTPGVALLLTRTALVLIGKARGFDPGIIWRNECIMGEDNYKSVPNNSQGRSYQRWSIGLTIVFACLLVAFLW